MTPMIGHGSAAEAALAEHGDWRAENDDRWMWDVYEVISGEGTGTFYARSGQHMWDDLDAYMLEGADAHFEETVSPTSNPSRIFSRPEILRMSTGRNGPT